MRILISDDYMAQQKMLHENVNYGRMSEAYAPLISIIINRLSVKELLDYGCGKGRLKKVLKTIHPVEVRGYDPGVEEYSMMPEPAEMVACIDVLEHIEPEFIDNVLDDLQRVTRKLIFLTVHTGPAKKTLPDGRNAHLIQEPAEWWIKRLNTRFVPLTFTEDNHGFVALMKPAL